MTQEFLNEEKLPFKECSREQQHILLDAYMQGKAEYSPGEYWYPAQNNIQIMFEWILRTKPVKRLAIPWEHIKPEYRWAAMDENYTLWAFEDKPKMLNSMYRSDRQQSLKVLNIDISGISWRDSLVERPADK